MRGNQHLSAAPGVIAELFGQFGHQFWVQLILRFLDAQQGVWCWVVEQNEVGEHLDRTVGDVAVKKWCFV